VRTITVGNASFAIALRRRSPFPANPSSSARKCRARGLHLHHRSGVILEHGPTHFFERRSRSIMTPMAAARFGSSALPDFRQVPRPKWPQTKRDFSSPRISPRPPRLRRSPGHLQDGRQAPRSGPACQIQYVDCVR
jgi:hypothetical protein